MKTIQVSNRNYKLLKYLGSDKWMSVKGEKPLSPEKVIHEIIEKEYEDAKPDRYARYEA